MEKILRSPFIMMVMLVLFGFMYIGFQEGWKEEVYILPILIVMIVYYCIVLIYNKRNPDKRIKVIDYRPYELREDDEGMQWITYQATRRVYIFYYFALPTGIVAITLLDDHIPYFPILLLVSFGLIQYFIFWFEFHRLLKEEKV